MSKIRLFIAAEGLSQGQQINIADKDFDYLFKVMRKKIGDEILIFNNLNGEWNAKITSQSKKSCILEAIEQTREFYQVPNITLAFSLIKNVKIDFIATKATEMGVRNFAPLITKNSVVNNMNYERFSANIKEACEQCERVDLANVAKILTLDKFLKQDDIKDKILILCDESGKGFSAQEVLPKIAKIKKLNQEMVVLIGPEGGFSKEEFEVMKNLPNLYSLSLGRRILRADTAIIAALSLVQEFLGDFLKTQ